MTLSSAHQDLRGLLTRLIAQSGRAPTPETLSHHAHLSTDEVEVGLKTLHDAHALLLHPGTTKPWVVHPFALSPGSCWVQTQDLGYWANCLYCAFGIAACLDCDAHITTRYGGESETVQYRISNRAVEPSSSLFHLSVPVANWWDNVIHACASFQPFKHEQDIDNWCRRHDFDKGAVMTIPHLWDFARDWYGGYLNEPWRKRTSEEVEALFKRHNLSGPFWSLNPS